MSSIINIDDLNSYMNKERTDIQSRQQRPCHRHLHRRFCRQLLHPAGNHGNGRQCNEHYWTERKLQQLLYALRRGDQLDHGGRHDVCPGPAYPTAVDDTQKGL